MFKFEKEYNEKFGNISEDSLTRISEFVKDLKLSRYKDKVYDRIHEINKIKWNKISYTIYLVPKPTPRPKLGKRGIFYVTGASDNKKFFKKFTNNLDINIITTPVKFICKCYLPIPKSMHPVEKILAELGFIYPISKPDWDNLGKAYCDMIQDTLLYDDSLIIEGTTIKRYSLKPRIEIEIEYMEDYDSKFNYNKMNKKGKKG